MWANIFEKQSVIDNTNIQESTSLTSCQKHTTQPGFELTILRSAVRYATDCATEDRNRRPETRGAGPGCRKIFTLYAVEDRLGFVKNGRGIVERKFVDLSSETKSREFLQMVAEISLVENRSFNLRPSGGGAYVTTLSVFLRITKKPRRVAPRRLA